MPRSYPLPPRASSLMASLRDLGYSLETAIADLVDNSITAGATEIDIFCDPSRDFPVLGVADNGHGMSEAQLLEAMRHGTKSPRVDRQATDLGRFGLGLKTASFSQCRRLTVVSRMNGGLAGAEWDLTIVEAKDDWLIQVLETDEIETQPFFETLNETGTLVVWGDLDRMLEDETGHRRHEVANEKLGLVERHLSLVFHRFLAGEVKGRKKLAMRINGHPVPPFDPFCRKNKATQMLPEETVWVDDVPVTIQPFILPHHSRLDAVEYDFYQDRSDFISNQGAYVYRNGRLMAWGDWFRLVPKGEATKLARVQIDFPNSLDEAWTIDIKKSRARPPHAVRERLRQIINQITTRSVSIHRGRGQKLFEENAPFWERYADHGRIRYAVNSKHPLLESLLSRLSPADGDAIQMLLDSISASLPIDMIYSDYSTSPREVDQSTPDAGQTLERLQNLKRVLYGDGPGDSMAFLDIVRSTRLFEGQIETAEKFIAEAFA
jgi:hypothetical protein